MPAETLIVVRLDNARHGGGPATILNVLPPGSSVMSHRACLQALRDKDGCLPATIRTWRGHVGARVGDRCSL